MAPLLKPYTLVMFLFFVSASSQLPININQSFIFPIFHRDSPKSPFHNPNTSIHWESARQRSIQRRHYMLSSLMPSSSDRPYNLVTPLVPGGTTELMMKLSVGTPPFETMAMLDTASKLTWFQCSQCKQCYEQNIPKFDPSQSSSHVWMDCNSEDCKKVPNPGCSVNNECTYTVHYEDRSNSYGRCGYDTLTMNSTAEMTIVFPQILFGCGDENTGIFPTQAGGLVGFSGDETSLISQLGISPRFSYCFQPLWSEEEGAGTGRLYLGSTAPLIGRRSPLRIMSAKTSPLVGYFVSLEDISVGFNKLHIPEGTFDRRPDGSNGVIVDSGSTFTYLNSRAFDMVVEKLKEEIKLEVHERFGPPLCFEGTDQDFVNFPYITLHFTNLDVRLPPSNTFTMLSRDSICLIMDRANEGEPSMIGSFAQQNMNMGFDIGREVFTMAPARCFMPF